MRYIFVWLLSLFVTSTSLAGEFKCRTGVFSVDSTGFYFVRLSPQVVGESRENLADLRILDSDNNEVAYVAEQEIKGTTSSHFFAYPMVARHQTDTSTVLIFHNDRGTPINSLCLMVNNAEVTKTMHLNGSNDQESWYSVKESETIHSFQNASDVTEIMTIAFPLVDYKYFRLFIDDSNSAPVKINAVGYSVSNTRLGDYTEVIGSFEQSNSVKEQKSFVDISLNGRRLINRMDVEVNYPSVFLRDVDLYYFADADKQIMRYLTSFVLKSGEDASFDIGECYSYGFRLVINNNDNRPLEIYDVNMLMLNRYCVAELHESEEYHLVYGNDSMASPHYDLVNFKELYAGDLPVVNHGKVAVIPSAKVVELDIELVKMLWYQNSVMIWIAIIVVAFLLAFVSFKMLNDKK